MARRIEFVEVSGLFGYINHALSIETDAPTIIAGPNGIGKTQLLLLVRAAFMADFKYLLSIQFSHFVMRLQGGFILRFSQGASQVGEEGEEVKTIHVALRRFDHLVGDPIELSAVQLAERQGDLPDYIVELADGNFFDTRAGRVQSPNLIKAKFRYSATPKYDLLKGNNAIRTLIEETQVILIDTKRLDTYRGQGDERIRGAVGVGASSRVAASRISEYIDQIRFQIAAAKNQSVNATQSADLSFAMRALQAAHDRVKEVDLQRKYRAVTDQFEELTVNGLTTGEDPPPLPEDTTPTIRRILNVFLDDWQKRLAPLVPLNDRLSVLRRILDSKLGVTGKSTAISPAGRLQILGRSNAPLRLTALSSGEQHLIAVFTLLLFSASPRSLVLIDEPEISMHAAWKHEFLSDIAEVSRLNGLQVVMATHSSAIINGQWDLVRELSPGADDLPIDDADSGSEEDEDDWV